MLLATEINLFPDKTIFIQLGIFLVVLFALNALVFQPVLKILRLRRSKTEGDREKLEDLNRQTTQIVKEYEDKMSQAKAEAFAMKEAIRKEGELQGQRIVQEARAASLAQIEKMKQEIQSAAQKTGEELERQSDLLSRNIAEKVLGRSLGH